jgi:hypothetical protein
VIFTKRGGPPLGSNPFPSYPYRDTRTLKRLWIKCYLLEAIVTPVKVRSIRPPELLGNLQLFI